MALVVWNWEGLSNRLEMKKIIIKEKNKHFKNNFLCD